MCVRNSVRLLILEKLVVFYKPTKNQMLAKGQLQRNFNGCSFATFLHSIMNSFMVMKNPLNVDRLVTLHFLMDKWSENDISLGLFHIILYILFYIKITFKSFTRVHK